MTPLGLLNFLVLQWFGVRLARVVERQYVPTETVEGHVVRLSMANREYRYVTVGWRILRWVWPLTGWWSDFRWFARRP